MSDQTPLSDREYLAMALDIVAKQGGRGINIYSEPALLKQTRCAIKAGLVKKIEPRGRWARFRQTLNETVLGEISGFTVPILELTEEGGREYKRFLAEGIVPDHHGSYVFT